ncbi:MAG TPA: helix-hairpin-helix domain-containing protein [Flavisolibacter sp.]|nr:helix-hairpin-helix domain-containing protein [Flavisolibacter sp.]
MDNYEIADQLSLLSKMMDIHGENTFKAKSYASAAFTIEKLPEQIADLTRPQIFKIRGIGETVGKKVIEIIETGELQDLKELLNRTPQGVLEMMNIKGLGPKKIHVLWKEIKIDSLEELRRACEEKRLSLIKGLGDKTEQKILESLQFQERNTGKYLYSQIESFAEAFHKKLMQKFTDYKTELTGEYRRQLEVITKIEWVTTIPKEKLINYLITDDTMIQTESDSELVVDVEGKLLLHFHLVTEDAFASKLFTTSCSEEFLQAWEGFGESKNDHQSEEEIFTEEGLHFIPPYLREKPEIIEAAERNSFSNIIQVSDIKGLIHSHSNWSDGGHTIEDMVIELIQTGFEYLVISDHSKAAFYANGLSEERIREQHRYIDEINKKYAPFKVFKSVECDILSDGSLDYADDVLSTFDLVICSIHSNQQMNEEKAMKRLLGAITNPYTTLLGHMTGRLLLKRKGYPVDHKVIIDACAEHNVVIEINANPKRLDMDWRFIDYALKKNVLLSIDPDAHTFDEFPYIKYGVLVAQKGGLTKENNLSSYSLQEFESYLARIKELKGIS